MWIPVPSVSSTWQLIFPDDNVESVLDPNSMLYKLQHYNAFKKIIFVVIPYLISTLGYCYPIIMLVLYFLGKIDIVITALSILGVVFLFLGRWLTIYSALLIRKDNSQKEDDFELKTKGIFKKSRNPIVLGLHLGIIGMNLIFPSVIFLLLTIVYILHIHFKIVLEEDFLKQFFKGSYEAYHSKTKRYL